MVPARSGASNVGLHIFASSYVCRPNGAMPPSWWHPAQRSATSGAMSWCHVGASPAGSAPEPELPATLELPPLAVGALSSVPAQATSSSEIAT